MTFEVISNNKLVGRPDGVVFEWCVELSLLFVSMNRMSIWVFRVNGERIYSINNKSAIVSLTFLDNGNMFAVSGVDNLIKIYDSNTGKLVGVVGGVTFQGISSMKWVPVGPAVPPTPFHIDVLSQMPKLHEVENELNAELNVLVVLDAQEVYFNFNNAFTIAHTIPDEIQLIKHIGSVSITNTLMLTTNGEIVGLRLEGDDSVVYNLKQVIGWSCQLVSLHRMVHEQLEIIAHEVKTFLTLFDRYLSNMENSEQLYHILLTNRVPLESRDYWLNVLGERGLKRLKKQGDTAYEIIRSKLYYLTTILDRMIIIMSRMKGLQSWHKDEYNYGLENINSLIEYPQNLIKNLYQLLHQCNKEQDMFSAFLVWVKTVVIDGNEGSNVDYLNLVEYFNEGLYKSTMSKYFKVEDLEIMQCTLEVNLLSYSESFLAKLENELLSNVSSALTDKLHFTSPISLGVEILAPDFVLTSTWNNTFGYIIVRNSSSLTMLEFPLHGSVEIKRKVLPINFSLLEYKLDARYIYLLYEIGGIYKLDLLDINSVINSSEETLEEIPRTSIQQVQMVNKPEMIAVKSGLCGILDNDRQSYVFLRNQQFGV